MRKWITKTAGVLAMVAGSAHADVKVPELRELKMMTARFAPTQLTADIGALPPNERRALAKLVEAGKMMDALFLRQTWAGNSNSLAWGILRVLHNPRYAREMAERAYEQVKTVFNWKLIAAQTTEVYKRCLQEYKVSSW